MKFNSNSKRNCFWMVLLGLALGGCGKEVSPGAEEESATHRSVINGLPSPLDSLTIKRVMQGGKQCTGTVIGPRTMLTAAHCVIPSSATQVESPGNYPVSTYGTDWVCEIPAVHNNRTPAQVFTRGPDLALCRYFRGLPPGVFETVSLDALPASSPLEVYGYGLRGIFSTSFGNGLVFASLLQASMTPLVLQKGTIMAGHDFIPSQHPMYRNDFASPMTEEVPIPSLDGALSCASALVAVALRIPGAGNHLAPGDSGGPAFLKSNGRRTVRGVGHGNSYFVQPCQAGGETRNIPSSVAQDYFVSLSSTDARAFFESWVAQPNRQICGVNGYRGVGCR